MDEVVQGVEWVERVLCFPLRCVALLSRVE